MLVRASPARANGRFPASNQILFSPSVSPGDSSFVVARTTYAILPSRDNGATWSYLCEDALGLPSSAFQDPALVVTASGALVAGLATPTAGLDVSTDFGCTWSCAAGSLGQQSIVDVAVRPDQPHVVVALTSTYLAADAGGGTFAQVFQSPDDGASWTALGVPIDPTVRVQTIDAAATDAHRLYVSGTRGFGASKVALLFASTDDGASWTEHALDAFDPGTEDSVYIGAVDPTDAARVYLRSSAVEAGGQSRLFITGDGGQSFQVATRFEVPPPAGASLSVTGEILGFALSPEGSKVYAGTKEAGLFVASKADLTFVKTSSIHVQCLATRGSELWACSDAVSGFVVGVSTDDGATFTAKLPTITSLAGPLACGAEAGTSLACGATANGSQCVDSFNLFCETDDVSGRCVGGEPRDSGSPDAGGAMGADAAVAPAANAHDTSVSRSSCAFSAPGSEGSASGAALCTVCAFALRRRRLRRR